MSVVRFWLTHGAELTVLLEQHVVLVLVSTLVAVAVGLLSPWVLLVVLSVPQALALVRTFRVQVPDMADALTAKLDTVFGMLFIAALVVEGLIRR